MLERSCINVGFPFFFFGCYTLIFPFHDKWKSCIAPKNKYFSVWFFGFRSFCSFPQFTFFFPLFRSKVFAIRVTQPEKLNHQAQHRIERKVLKPHPHLPITKIISDGYVVVSNITKNVLSLFMYIKRRYRFFTIFILLFFMMGKKRKFLSFCGLELQKPSVLIFIWRFILLIPNGFLLFKIYHNVCLESNCTNYFAKFQ